MEDLETIFADLFLFVDELIKDYGEPTTPSSEEIEDLEQKIINNPANKDPHLQKHFYLIERVAGEILFSYNVDKFLGLEGEFDLMTFHSYIDDGTGSWHYLKDYLSWGKVAYLMFREKAKTEDLSKFSFRTRLPMRCIDGKIYWVLQETYAMELDKNNNMISHINTYTISHLFNEKEPVNISAEFFCDGSYMEELNKMYIENRYAIKPFILTPIQREILTFYYNTPKVTTPLCAKALNYPLNTIKKYISDSQHKQGIIDKTKSSFPQIPIRNLKDVVSFLEKIGWFI